MGYLLLIVACSNNDDSISSFELNSPKDNFVARIYVDMWGGSAGGVDYIVNVQKKLQKSNSSKHVLFKASKEGSICMDWIDEDHLKVSTDINEHISIQKRVIEIDNKDIKIVYTSKKDSQNCISPQINQTKFDKTID